MNEVAVTLPDGTELSFEPGVTVQEVAYEIGPGLGKDTVAGVVDDELVDKHTPLHEDAALVIVTEQSDAYIRVLRHSAAHVFAQALQRCFPDATLTIGPATEEGFYYDVASVDLEEADLRTIESEMAEIVAADYEFVREERPHEVALEEFSDNAYKREILRTEAADAEMVSFYSQDGWEDLCQGPHVESTGMIGGFKLLDISAAYWRGEESNETLTRVYGTAFPTEEGLETHLERREAAKERDHRRLGREMELFSIDSTTGPGLPLYHPNGKRILNELSEWAKALNQQAGYEPVETPHLFRTDLWKKSGHYDNYVDDMFLLEVNDDEYGLKPMNCPGHATIFDQRSWSYRDLPVRYYENGKVYRKEQRGELSGLSRVWAFTIDDGHLFCRPDQIRAEIEAVIGMIMEVVETVGLDVQVSLATRPEKAVGSDEIWESAERQLTEVLEAGAYEYTLEAGGGAFYGPKIDFGFEDALGRVWDGPTVQLDFNMPDRFDLTYTGEDNEDHQPVMIHRALYGSYERFFMVLIEHFDGKFPLWLAPEQVRVLPVSDNNMEYAQAVCEELGARGLRATVEDRDHTVGRKIRAAHEDRLPYMLIVGDDEEQNDTLSIRDRQEREAGEVDPERFFEHLSQERADKQIQPSFLA
jgi:threonyl-tRNA synthetase